MMRKKVKDVLCFLGWIFLGIIISGLSDNILPLGICAIIGYSAMIL